MPNYYNKDFLRTLRNDISISEDITDMLLLTVRHESTRLRFRCPRCYQYHTGINYVANLARCFDCEENFNPIDLVMAAEECNFLTAVEKLDMEWFRKKKLSDISE